MRGAVKIDVVRLRLGKASAKDEKPTARSHSKRWPWPLDPADGFKNNDSQSTCWSSVSEWTCNCAFWPADQPHLVRTHSLGMYFMKYVDMAPR